MVQRYLEVLYDPESFFERGEEASSLAVPLAVLVLVGLIGAVTGWLGAQRTAEMMSRMDGAGGMGAGFAALTGSISIVVALVLPFLALVVYAGVFHGISALLDGERGFRTTLTYTAWGFLPKVVGTAAGLASTWFVFNAVPLPAETSPTAMQAYQQQVQSHPATLASTAVGVGMLLWSAYIWVAAVQHARDVDRTDAAIAVGIPVAIALVLRIVPAFLL